MKSLFDAAKYAENYDTLPETAKYTSMFVNRQEYRKDSTSKNWIGTERSMLYYRIAESVFDSIRDLPEFMELFESLSK